MFFLMLKSGVVGRRLTTKGNNWNRNHLGNFPARHFAWCTRNRTTWHLLVYIYGESAWRLPLELHKRVWEGRDLSSVLTTSSHQVRSVLSPQTVLTLISSHISQLFQFLNIAWHFLLLLPSFPHTKLLLWTTTAGHRLVTTCTLQHLCLLSPVKGVWAVFILVLILHCLENVILFLCGPLRASTENIQTQ